MCANIYGEYGSDKKAFFILIVYVFFLLLLFYYASILLRETRFMRPFTVFYDICLFQHETLF